ncbi:hypothetical protein B296_00039949 [Ensete ventricosum]|uniref:Uncharacterized protein n=1 Tax=Ensete ventricosum TaxID=4639 RepID=A0A426YWM5_ENSVE|nr:hypothetical protein B296_00039949 [Ensete ventricosum]
MAGLATSSAEMDLDRPNIEEYLTVESIQELPEKLNLSNCSWFRRDLLDISPTLREAAGAINLLSVACFNSFIFNTKLRSLMCCCRVIILAAGCIVFFAAFSLVHFLLGEHNKWKHEIEVFVANHTSMIDFIILEQMTAFAVIMQKHPGWVGKRPHLLDFEPYSYIVARFIYMQHLVATLLLFGRQSFTMHLVQLMTSWAVVCDVWYLEPQYIRPGETPIEFAER